MRRLPNHTSVHANLRERPDFGQCAQKQQPRVQQSSGEERSKLLIIYLFVAVLVQRFEEVVNLDRHAKFVFDNMDQSCGVYEPGLVRVATEGNEGIKGVKLVLHLLLTTALLLKGA